MLHPTPWILLPFLNLSPLALLIVPPSLTLSFLALVARDPRPAIAAALYLTAGELPMVLPMFGLGLTDATLILATELLAITAVVQSRRLLASGVPIPPS